MSAEWPKHNDIGETTGHESGRHIYEILSKNPTKDPEKYDEDGIAHMRKVILYRKRHLAQEKKSQAEPKQQKYVLVFLLGQHHVSSLALIIL